MKINDVLFETSEIDQAIQQIKSTPAPQSTASKIGKGVTNVASGATNAVSGAVNGLTDIINKNTSSDSFYTAPDSSGKLTTQSQSNQYLVQAQNYIKKILNNTPIAPTSSAELNKFLQQINLLSK